VSKEHVLGAGKTFMQRDRERGREYRVAQNDHRGGERRTLQERCEWLIERIPEAGEEWRSVSPAPVLFSGVVDDQEKMAGVKLGRGVYSLRDKRTGSRKLILHVPHSQWPVEDFKMGLCLDSAVHRLCCNAE
jgi:hypothetical protein